MSKNPFLRDDPSASTVLCANAVVVEASATLGNLDYRFESLGDYISKFKIRDCKNNACLTTKAKLAAVAPACRWRDFRNWALVVVSCSIVINKFSEYENIYIPAMELCSRVLIRCRNKQFRDLRGVDVFGTLEMLFWLIPVKRRGHIYEMAMENCLDQQEIEAPAFRRMLYDMPNLPVCQRRLWSLVSVAPRKFLDLPTISSLIRDRLPEDFQIGQHKECSADLCLLDDDNTTQVSQRHKCSGTGCNDEQEVFDLRKIDEAITPSFTSTAWALRKERSLDCSKYMAISHVWADGTGVGLKPAGTVNKCLVSFFMGIARELGCDGIWWDPICLPTTREKKALAMNRMHLNYRKAHYTLIHDEALVNFDWKDDGSPCLALALSTWFTRGWTALELWESRHVKVLFRDPETQSYVIKDLKRDVLTCSGDIFVHPGYRAVSGIIHRLLDRMDIRDRDVDRILDIRDRDVDRILNIRDRDVDRILDILKPRYTSWTRDRLIVAGLMACVEGFESTWSKSKITQEILCAAGRVSPNNLLHGHTTMANTGAWSWCPVSLLDLSSGAVYWNETHMLEVKPDGTITGDWCAVPLDQAQIRSLVHSHISIQLRLQAALRNPQKCLLLFTYDWLNKTVGGRCLLVKNLGHLSSGSQTCEYVGTVMADVTALSRWHEGSRWFVTRVVLGSTEPAKIQPMDYCGLTPLHWAVKAAMKTYVKDLKTEAKNALFGDVWREIKNLSNPADINIKDGYGNTPLDYVKYPSNWDELYTLLGENGAIKGKYQDSSLE